MRAVHVIARRMTPQLVFLAPLILAAIPIVQRPSPLAVHLDHVPIAVRDLKSATAQFESLGFTIKPGRPHQNGIENASIKFADGSYLELITAHNGTDTLARQYEDFLKAQEGAAYVFLRDTEDGAFSRRLRREGGRREEARPFAFTKLPPSWRAPHLQLIEYLGPAQDTPETYRHSNGARRLAAIWMMVEHTDDPITRELGARPSVMSQFAFDDRASRPVSLRDGTCLLLTTRRPGEAARPVARGLLIEVDSLARLRRQSAMGQAIVRGPAVWLPFPIHGVRLGFVEADAWSGCAQPM